jgi:hypothetical protein
VKEKGVEFVAIDQPSIGLEPTYRAFDGPPIAVPYKVNSLAINVVL